jgi:hypothetical protein
MVERVTAMQHPAVAGVDCDASVTSGVAGQRDEHDAGSYFVELLRRCESSPGFSFWAVFDDAQLGCPLLVAISNLLLTGGRGECRERFRSGDVDLRMRKIRYAADMVRVEVRDHNVATSLRRKPSWSIWCAAVSVGTSTGRVMNRTGPTRPGGSAQSSRPKPASTRTSPLSVSTSST